MKLKTAFFVDKAKLAFFTKFLKIEKRGIFEDANKELIYIENLWSQRVFFMEKFFFKVFNETLKDEIKIFIFPQYFYLGAVETSSRIILFGQPSRTKNFSSAIMAHEIGHIFLSKNKLKRPIIVDEIICFMLEDYIYSIFDGKSLTDVWKKDELDLFHFNAMKVAISEIKKRGSINNRNVYEIISTLINQLDKVVLSIKPKKGLIKNITPRNKI